MPLPTAHLLATVVAPRTASLGGLGRLRVDNGGARGRLSARQATQALAKGGVYPPPCTVDAPRPEVVVGGLPGQEEVVRKQPPGAPSPQHVEDGVQQLACFVGSGTPAGLGF